ncbi:unnamed protein product (macronuclear) [Paramecium tetraurelia]|uniref:G domain-containing protein n=1 Tax=Paramecium tetraurelia TaxID=5888 RepID=A0BS81_PARTE|nr:uncharacterized protein GSPATT00031629001 [Paramecium tetraurelia]CAK61398.1 unnamed protein product [Paramecium tetraurelia]|eukprot:XP_001428796.1 hypothetical protein (macronuclear) [Paramecium tetraurelia strain d4-2]
MGQQCCGGQLEPNSSLNDQRTKQPKNTLNQSENHYYNSSLNNKKQEDIKSDGIKEAEIKSKGNQKSSSYNDSNNNQFAMQLEDKSYIVLVGQSGVGKDALIELMTLKGLEINISRNSKDNEPKIKEGILGEEYVIVDTPSFQLDDEIDKREAVIKEFQEYFEVPKQISSIGVVVNFERTDIMKKKVTSVLKYLRKFKNIISIIVVNMELSENEEEDKNHLRNSFKHMECNKIIFINKYMNQEEILEQFMQITPKEKTKIDFTDTIFEKPNITEEENFLKMLNEHFSNLRQP